MGLTLKVEREPEDLRRLALELAEALQAAASCQGNAESFLTASKSQRSIAAQLRITIDQVVAYRKNGPPPGTRPRRMDPMNEYDVEAMRAELKERLTQADALRDKADQFQHAAAGHRSKARVLEAKIAQARKGNGSP